MIFKMKLINPEKISFHEVVENYKNQHGSSSSRNPELFNYDIGLLEKANNYFSFWVRAGISTKENLENLVLPHYIDKKSQFRVTSEKGERLKTAYERLMVSERNDFKKNVPECFKKIMIQKKLIIKGYIGTFLFSHGPFKEMIGTYDKITGANNSLVHLDGFHRLLALMDMLPEEKPYFINSYIAVKENFFEVFGK